MASFCLKENCITIKCRQCDETPNITIDLDKFMLSSNCKNGHLLNDLSFTDFNKYCFKNLNIPTEICKNCNSNLNNNDNYFLCLTCNKYYCKKCINNHIKKEKHNKYFNLINSIIMCPKHNLQYNLFCHDCKINICQECDKLHKNHLTESLLDIIPNAQKKEMMKMKNKEKENEITKIINNIKNAKKNIDERYRKLEDYLLFLQNININLLQKFNFSNYDYYNYECYNYFYNHINNEEILDEAKYIDYLLYGKSLNSNKNMKNKKQSENQNIYKEYYNYGELFYFRNNLFVSYEDEKKKKFLTIKLYEFKNNSLRCIYKYSFNKLIQVEKLEFSKYSEYIYIILKQTKNIKIIKYNSKEKTLSPLNEEIKMQRTSNCNQFNEIIDDINGNIITSDNNGIIVWKKDDKNNKYMNIISNKGLFANLFNVNNSIFTLIYDKFYMCFYSTDNYQLINFIKFNNAFNIEFLGTIQNKIFIFQNKQDYQLFILDLQYFEIIQKIQLYRYYCMFIHEKFLIKISFNDNGEFVKERLYFDWNEGVLRTYDISKIKVNINYFSQILLTDDEYFIVHGKNEILYIKL